MDRFSVNQLAKLAGVSVRTLHHYDEIGLLKPGTRTESNYRYYGEQELLRLQQILFYKELDIPLAKIAGILDDPSFDAEDALVAHKKELVKRRDRANELLKTIDKTLIHLKNQAKQNPDRDRFVARKKMKAEDMYHGFNKEQLQAYEKEASEKYGSRIMEESKERLEKWVKKVLLNLLQNRRKLAKSFPNLCI